MPPNDTDDAKPEDLLPKDRPPDAILFPEGWKLPGAPHHPSRVHYLLDVLEPILGGGPGKRGYLREVGGGMRLASLGKDDTLLHPTGHPMERHERYEWWPVSNGLRYGYLKPDEHAEAFAAPEAVADRARRAEKAFADYRAKAQRFRELAGKEGRSPEEDAELLSLESTLFPTAADPNRL